MSLPFDPTYLFGSSGNLLAYTNLGHNPAASSTSFMVDFSQSLGGTVQVWGVATGIATTNGILIQSYSTPDNMWYDTIPYGVSFILPVVTSSTVRESFSLDTGKYNILLTNLDPLNGISVLATSGILT